MSVGTITTGSIPRLLQEGIHDIFGDSYKEYPQMWKHLFYEKGSSKAFEIDVQVEGFGLATIKPEGQEVTFDSRRQGFTPKYIHTTFAKGFVVTEEAMEDNLYDISLGDSSNLATSMRQTEEVVSHQIYNRAFNAAALMIDGDGKSLIATDHPFGPSKTGSYSNRLSTNAAFSETSMEDMMIQIDRTVDARGLNIELIPLKLIGPSELKFDFERVLGSVLQNDSANNAVNALNSLSSIRDGWITSPYLSSVNAWYVRTNSPNGMCSFNRRKLSFGEDNSFTTGNARFKATQRYSKGWTDPRGLFGSEGTV